jgi:hypothetical protein
MGQTVTKSIDRPKIVSFLFQYVSEIDEHNRQRQHLLALEKCWPTKKCWEKLWLTVIGMCVVDLHRLYKYKSDAYNDYNITKFSDLICEPLELQRKRKRDEEGTDPASFNARSPKKTKSPTRTMTGRKSGSTKQAGCWICRMYGKKQVFTSHVCTHCSTPICKKSRINPEQGRTETCMAQHLQSQHPRVKCTPGSKKGNLPTALKKY